MALTGAVDLGLALFLVPLSVGWHLWVLLLPLLILLPFAAWMFLQAWGYWILRIEHGGGELNIRAPGERFGIFLPPAQRLRCRCSEVEEVRILGRRGPRTPGTGMILRMPTDVLIITARGGRSVRLTYPMFKQQLYDIAALLGREPGR